MTLNDPKRTHLEAGAVPQVHGGVRDEDRPKRVVAGVAPHQPRRPVGEVQVRKAGDAGVGFDQELADDHEAGLGGACGCPTKGWGHTNEGRAGLAKEVAKLGFAFVLMFLLMNNTRVAFVFGCSLFFEKCCRESTEIS